VRSKNLTAYLFIALHFLAEASVLYFDVDWSSWRRPPVARIMVGAGLLVCLGADLCMLGLWLALSPAGRTSRRLKTALCVICWCGVYNPEIYSILRDWAYYRDSALEYYAYGQCAATGGFVILVISILAGAFSTIQRRGLQFRRLSEVELHLEASSRQFQVLDLLVLAGAISLFLGFSINCRAWFSRQISMRWYFIAYAPIQSAETVFFSALLLATAGLALVWAALAFCRPWLKLAMAVTAVGLLGFLWAYAFTSTRHQQYLPWNGLVSMAVALLQALLISGALLVVRRCGYRLMRKREVVEAPDA
jgi:hypothetical protein